jgi:hypothetical protein
MVSDQNEFPGGTGSSDANISASTPGIAGISWWIQVIRVRLRFLLIVLVAGGIVSQWTLVRSLWDRWTWRSRGPMSGSVSSANEYFCPMDPGVISVWPAICPICNMDLVPRRKMEAQLLPEGVVARMQLSPYRIQLAGIRTVAIETRPLAYEYEFTGVVRPFGDGSTGFESVVPEGDVPLFTVSHPAEFRLRSYDKSVLGSATLIDNHEVPRLRFVLEETTSISKGSIVTATVRLPVDEGNDVVAVPENAVIDRGREQLVYVETMPGVFDGMKVELGQRCGSYYPVVNGLKPGQKVAASGSFLIDAETRLNPSLAAGYFGASQKPSRETQKGNGTANPVPQKARLPQPSLSKEDQELVDKQQFCPVTDLSLDAMGGPVAVMLAGRKVFICCAGCEQRLKNEPDRYLARLKK